MDHAVGNLSGLLFVYNLALKRPRSSMDRVTDFESGGCAFDPRRGRLFPYAFQR
jgi:hypothetical protein